MKIFEGGNSFWLNRETGEPEGYAEKVDLRKFPRGLVVSAFVSTFNALNNHFNKKFGEPIWDDFSVVESGEAFNGSSEAMFNKEISDEEFVQHKPTVGDIDITIPDGKGDQVFELLMDLEGQRLFDNQGVSVTYRGNNKAKPSGLKQINAVFTLDTPNGSVNPQVDFEYSEYEDNKPTEWAKFSHNSDWEDIKSGFKGVAHKYALMNLARAISKKPDAMVVTPGSYKKFLASGDPDDLTISNAAAAKNPRTLAFAVTNGLRHKYKKVVDQDGNPVDHEGKDLYVEIPTKQSDYKTSLPDIYRVLFADEPSADELQKLNSFTGLLQLMSEHMDEGQVKDFMDYMVGTSLFSPERPRSQELERDSAEADADIKWAIVDKIMDVFPFLEKFRGDIMDLADKYYEDYGMTRMKETLDSILEDRRYTFSQFCGRIDEAKKNTPDEKRTLRNKPKGTPIGEWMKCSNGGKSKCDDKYYGWSHRAAYGFGVGDKIEKDSLANYKDKEFTIKTEDEAKKCAEHFRDEVS